jgi:hypothetical protein
MAAEGLGPSEIAKRLDIARIFGLSDYEVRGSLWTIISGDR